MWDRHEHDHEREHFASVTDVSFWGWPEVAVLGVVVVAILLFTRM